MIYLIKVFCLRKNEYRDRTWGFYKELKDAKKAVKNNYTDLFEINYYDHVCILTVNEGIPSMAVTEQWYFADYTQGKEPKVKFMGNFKSYSENARKSPLSKFRKEFITVELEGEAVSCRGFSLK